jgi:uncharacterized protein (TIGR02453 family)
VWLHAICGVRHGRGARLPDVTFRGFPDSAFTFYEGLRADNSRTYWSANKATYTSAVREPMDELLAALHEYGPFHVFRPNRDVRFSADKTPYKDHIGAYGESEGGAGFYVQLSSDGMLAGSGYYAMASDQLARFRAAVDASATGNEITDICAAVTAAGMQIGAIAELKTAPRGYPKDHPRIALIRRKGLMASRSWAPASWMHSPRAVSRVRDTWHAATAMNDWLDAHVGPSNLPPDDRPF